MVAVAGEPIRLGSGPIGTLNVYRSQAQDWDDSDIAALRAYTELAGGLLTTAVSARDHSVLAEQLQYALTYRIIIGSSLGGIIGRHHRSGRSAS